MSLEVSSGLGSPLLSLHTLPNRGLNIPGHMQSMIIGLSLSTHGTSPCILKNLPVKRLALNSSIQCMLA